MAKKYIYKVVSMWESTTTIELDEEIDESESESWPEIVWDIMDPISSEIYNFEVALKEVIDE